MSIRNLIELILLAAIWGASFLFMRIATPEFGAVALIEVRVLVASVFLMPIWCLRDAKHQSKVVISHWPHLLIVGILNSAVPFVLFAYSTLHISGGFSSILNATAPIWGALVAWVWLRSTLSLEATIGLGFGLLGVAILVSKSISLSISGVSLGIFAALGASFMYGVAANYTSEKLKKVSPLSIATFSQVAASLMLLPAALWYFPQQQISPLAWGSVIAMGVVCTGLAYTMYFRLIANVGSSKAITVTFLIPIFGTLWGALFIAEEISSEMVIGTGVILFGTALVTGVLSFTKKELQHKV
jgi:drug/metabolite transporter (DMT)-like permease